VCEFPREGKNENREGAAGGFKENDNVEYRRVEEDDEFDEFGRRKKNWKQSSADRDAFGSPGATSMAEHDSAGAASAEVVPGEEVEEEEEEEDESDVDDSKYDLFAVRLQRCRVLLLLLPDACLPAACCFCLLHACCLMPDA
jgi:hypothetical protein